MDIRRALTTITIFTVIFFGVNYLTSLWAGKKPDAAAATQPASYATAPDHPRAMEDGATFTPILLGDPSSNGSDKLAITINPITAGIDLVQLNVKDYAQTIKKTEPLRLLEATPGLPKPYATLGVHITLGNASEELSLGLGDFGTYDPDPSKNAPRAAKIHAANNTALYDLQYAWKLANRTPTQTTLLLTIDDAASKPVVEITKTFQIDPATYNVIISHQIKNLSSLPIRVAIDQMAATDLPRQQGLQDDRFFHAAALSSAKNVIDPNQFNSTHADLQKIKDTTKDIGQLDDFSAGKDPYLWVAASNRFFVAITRPLPQSPTATYKLADDRIIPMPQHVAEASIDVLHHADTPLDSLYALRLTGNPVIVGATSSTNLPLSIFFGPKKRDLLQGRAGAAPEPPPTTTTSSNMPKSSNSAAAAATASAPSTGSPSPSSGSSTSSQNRRLPQLRHRHHHPRRPHPHHPPPAHPRQPDQHGHDGQKNEHHQASPRSQQKTLPRRQEKTAGRADADLPRK